ncbi:hypothetical protein H0H81_007968 [Sphagnurus paluster]|uniref:Glycoside hydrolase family 71 protein n=1 Tax=Sphagnurus paluster TaxID=117069 RepID=A0A9P7K385_9AGAR|nr:hypothetical protein H0H81_007968 [Sphagnurus paluster]
MLFLAPLLVLSSFIYVAMGDDLDAQVQFDNKPPPPAPPPEQKLVVAHFMVGNTYPYQVADWSKDIILASSKGIDAFVLNVGRDEWQPKRVADAFTAAQKSKTGFKLFLSFDMSSLPCATLADATALRNYIISYRSHPNQLIYPLGSGRLLVSTFAGEDCRFGQGSLQTAWHYALKGDPQLPDVYFVPSFFVDPLKFGELKIIDGAFHWNSAWPMGNYNASFELDNLFLKNLGGKTYMAGISPWFFTHYGPDTYNKNFIYRCDDWHFAARWELIVKNRHMVDLAQVITWNDFGESHYVGPIAGAQPMSEAWTKGFDHQDYLWAVALLPTPAAVTLSCGSSHSAETLPAGLSKMRLRLSTQCEVKVQIWRKDTLVMDFMPTGFRFNRNPVSYNFNAFVAVSP